MKLDHVHAKKIIVALAITLLFSTQLTAELPESYDLRDVNDENFVTGVKSQSGGTCWAFGAYASPEGYLLMTEEWLNAGDTGQPNLAEYHLDWWNGFNDYFNDDAPDPNNPQGITVHQGGNYIMTSAYLTRGEGAVRDIDGQSFSSPPDRFSDDYRYYYPRDIEWYTAGSDLSKIDIIKEKVMTQGPISTCLTADGQFLSANYVHYQPPDDPTDLNHAVAIIGWDDNKVTQAPEKGAWLCKNSWGTDWGLQGFFWISYYDKYCGQHPKLGAASFYNVKHIPYPYVFYHDYHGWGGQKTDCSEAFNAFTADQEVLLWAINFVTAADSVNYVMKLYDDFTDGELTNLIAVDSGFYAHQGFHTIDLDPHLVIKPDENFYIYLKTSHGGQAIDMSNRGMETVGGKYRGWTISKSEPGQSYYHDGDAWQDLYEWNNTANFCIKGVAGSFTIVDNPPPVGHQYDPYEFEFKAVGGVKPYHWEHLSGQLPYGCAFIGDTIGKISGTPTWPAIYGVAVEMTDSDNPPRKDTIRFQFVIEDPIPICGDVNADREITISDAVYMINYIFMGGDEPDPIETGEVNCDGRISLVDAVYIINYIFADGYEPCDPDGDGDRNCMILE